MIDVRSSFTVHGSRLTDVIVIGSGPAGCAAASTCLKAGLSVLIVTDESEQIKIPDSSPVPLESIHPGVSSLLEKINAAGAEQDAACALYSGIYSGNNYAPLGEDANGIWQGMHIRRDIFNLQLLHRVMNLGVSVRFNEKMESFIQEKAESKVLRPAVSDPFATAQQPQRAKSRSSNIDDLGLVQNHEAEEKKQKNNVIGIRTRSADLYAKYIIDASGKNGIAGKKLNFKRKFYSPSLACWTGVSAIDTSFPFDLNAAHFIPGKTGWTWLAPQPPNNCAWTRLSDIKEKSFLPPDELKDYPTAGKIDFANMRWRLFRPTCTEGVILCGDAAGILDPAAGQGIFNALMTGIQAGNTVIKCIAEPDLASFQLAYYDDWFVGQFEGNVQKLKQYYQDLHIKIFD